MRREVIFVDMIFFKYSTTTTYAIINSIKVEYIPKYRNNYPILFPYNFYHPFYQPIYLFHLSYSPNPFSFHTPLHFYHLPFFLLPLGHICPLLSSDLYLPLFSLEIHNTYTPNETTCHSHSLHSFNPFTSDLFLVAYRFLRYLLFHI